MSENNCLVVLNMQYACIRPYSVVSCENAYNVIENIIKVSQGYNSCFIINDNHKNSDTEFNFLPPHAVTEEDKVRLPNLENRINIKNIEFLDKSHLSAIHSEHNRLLILNNKYDIITISGFSTSLDVIPTALSFLAYGQNINIIEECTGDLSEDRKNKSIDYMKFIGVPCYSMNAKE